MSISKKQAQINSTVEMLTASFSDRFIATQQLEEKSALSQGRIMRSVINIASAQVLNSAVEKMSKTDFNAVATIIANGDKSKNSVDYVQVKTIEKIALLLQSIAQNMQARNGNLQYAIKALLQNEQHANVKELIISQSKQARENDMSNVREGYSASSASYTIGTASSQTGQIRDALRIMQLATVAKNKRSDDCVLNEYGFNLLAPIFS